MTSILPEVKITQLLPEEKMGRKRIGFSVNLGEVGFRRFLSNLPHSQATQYLDRANLLKETAIEVMLPEECMDSFDLEKPEEALQEMGAVARHYHLNTTIYVLDRVLMAIEAA